MMANYEKRFPEDFELQAQFLELVNYVYRFESVLFWLFLISLTLSLPNVAKGKFRPNVQISFCKILKNK